MTFPGPSMSRRSGKDKSSAWRVTATSVLLGIVLLVILSAIGFPRNLLPARLRDGDLLRIILMAGVIACGSVALYGPAVSLEDAEVRSHVAGPNPHLPMEEPFAGALYALGGLGFLVASIIVLRSLYVIIF